ncbi:MAG TPA: hypothetical protein VFK58_03535 [Sphingomicrobium sp.]|nr:hypothetical protein [Sphingomicrobium sp.]
MTAAIEIERFASFDHPTQRFIAYALQQVPELARYIGNPRTHAGNPTAPFVVNVLEQEERAAAYGRLPVLRSCKARGLEGQRERRLLFGSLLAMAKVDLKWKRLRTLPAFIFLYERLAGAEWRELLIPCWDEAVVQHRKKGPTQLPLDRRLREDAAVPNLLTDDQPPMFYPSMADADTLGAPLLAGL